jgi:hypothetical protein
MTHLVIPVEAVDFSPPYPPPEMNVDWSDLIWAALTVGRPNVHFVFGHGQSSIYEAIFRTSLVRMALEEIPGSDRFRRTPTFRTMDPSEKGAINYFVGLMLCKAFAEKALNTPWLWHLDVFRTALNPTLSGTERSRPDLVGQLPNNEWIAFESKGRVSKPDANTKDRAKKQAERIISVNSQAVTGHYAGISYFNSERLRFFVQDPKPVSENDPRAIKLKIDEPSIVRAHYAAFATLLGRTARRLDKSSDGIVRAWSDEVDAELQIHSDLLKMVRLEAWEQIRPWCAELSQRLNRSELRADGINTRAGESWFLPLKRHNQNILDDS